MNYCFQRCGHSCVGELSVSVSDRGLSAPVGLQDLPVIISVCVFQKSVFSMDVEDFPPPPPDRKQLHPFSAHRRCLLSQCGNADVHFWHKWKRSFSSKRFKSSRGFTVQRHGHVDSQCVECTGISCL